MKSISLQVSWRWILSFVPLLLWLNPLMSGRAVEFDEDVIQQPTVLRIAGTHFLINDQEFRVRSVGLEPFMPGEMPPKPPTKLDYTNAVAQIKALHANTVYMLTGDPSNLQPAFFQRARAEGLYIILGLWFSGDADDFKGHTGDFQAPEFKEHVKSLIRNLVDRYHHMEDVDYSSQILYVSLGNEFQENAIRKTSTLHPNTHIYSGKYATISSADPTECFLAEMTDYYKSYEAEHYKEIHYVSHHTWPVVSPKLVKNKFLDVISYNLYSYWPESVSGHKISRASGTAYQGALEELASQYPGKPFVVSEFGISVAPKNVTSGTTEPGQATEIVARWKDIVSSSRYIAGGSVHELYDQWWKDDNVGPVPPQDENEHDPTDREEWFGLIEIGGTVDQPVFRLRPAFEALKNLWSLPDPVAP